VSKNNYFFIHGFLGGEDSFSEIISELKGEPETNEVFTPSLLSTNSVESLTPNYGFNEWAKNFNSYVKKNSNGNNILIGYSMGGRLGIHAFLDEPELWNSCYFASSNPGLIKGSEKMPRMAWEDGWCYQIDNKPWGEFISLWNQQEIFKHSKDINPIESDFDKNLLKLTLKNWSLTKHTVDLNKVNNKKLHWLVGEKDTKYQYIFNNLKNKYDCKQISTVQGAGHRFDIQVKDLNYSSPGIGLI